MKKVSTAAAKQIRNFSEQKLTIGLDLGDRSSLRSTSHFADEQDDDSRIELLDVKSFADRNQILLVTSAGEPRCLTLHCIFQRDWIPEAVERGLHAGRIWVL